jgi:U3 small nucleolar RNA-associated protein 24
MGKQKKQMNATIKKVMMKEKSITAKKKREMESYHEQPESPLDHIKDSAAVKYNKMEVSNIKTAHSHMFLSENLALKPPYHVWLDTNFINFSMQNKIEVVEGLMDCLLAKVIPCVCDCVMAELEKLGRKFRIALKIARDKRFKRLSCDNKYADDCVCRTVSANPIYIVATCDQDLKRRLRKIPGVPIMYISKHKFAIERLPDAE